MQYYVVRIDEKRYGKSREDVVKTMNEDGIFPRKYFYPLCSSFNPYENLAGSLPIAEKAVGETLSLPFFGDMSERDVDDVARLLGARS
jgi:dTDP-4-amino-4,6-dideoxygalactose transaminase